MLRQVYFSDDASIAGHRKIIRRPPLFLLEIYEKRIRNELLCDVVRKLLHDKKYEIPKDLLIETRNYLAHKIKSDSSDFVSHAAYLCLECAMVSRSSRHEKVLIAALQDLGRIETEYYQHPADEKGFTERSQHEIALARKNNEYERLQHVRELLKKLPIVKARSSSDLYIPNVRLEALRKDIDQRLSELKREISELAPSGDVTVRK
jgi:hypothetical protein